MEVVFHIMTSVIHMKIAHRVSMKRCVRRVYNRYRIVVVVVVVVVVVIVVVIV
jgi:hypothetical protein